MALVAHSHGIAVSSVQKGEPLGGTSVTVYSPTLPTVVPSPNSSEHFLAGHAGFGLLVRDPAVDDRAGHVLCSTGYHTHLLVRQSFHFCRLGSAVVLF